VVVGVVDELSDLVDNAFHLCVDGADRIINFDPVKDSDLESGESVCVGDCAHGVLCYG
jgi:hypothetical protein